LKTLVDMLRNKLWKGLKTWFMTQMRTCSAFVLVKSRMYNNAFFKTLLLVDMTDLKLAHDELSPSVAFDPYQN
jgi:hypothetical protein